MISFIIKYWIEFLFGIVTSLIMVKFKKFKDDYEMIKETKNSICILIKNEIIKEYYDIQYKKYVTIYDKEIINDLYKEYKNLGGNGFVENLIKDINSVPVKECGGD